MLDLIRPFAYLTIRHPSRLPLWVNWMLPLLMAVLTVAMVWALDLRVNVYGPQGLLERLLSFVQTLVGFYIAALAAVSSFNSPHLDKEMPHPAPTIQVKHNGGLQQVATTRRRFLTSMFAYLTAVSFLFSLLAIAGLTLAGPINALFPRLATCLWPIGLIGFLVALFQIASITFWGLFYLGERMLTPD